jgi:hypothetical protein
VQSTLVLVVLGVPAVLNGFDDRPNQQFNIFIVSIGSKLRILNILCQTFDDEIFIAI